MFVFGVFVFGVFVFGVCNAEQSDILARRDVQGCGISGLGEWSGWNRDPWRGGGRGVG